MKRQCKRLLSLLAVLLMLLSLVTACKKPAQSTPDSSDAATPTTSVDAAESTEPSDTTEQTDATDSQEGDSTTEPDYTEDTEADDTSVTESETTTTVEENDGDEETTTSADTTTTAGTTTAGTTTKAATTTRGTTTKYVQPRPWVTWTGTPTTKTTKATATSEVTTTTTTTTKAPTSDGPVESTSHAMILTYCYSSDGPGYTNKRQFACAVGYYPDGDMTKDPVDTMFDTFVFSDSPSSHVNSSKGGTTYFTKDYIDELNDYGFYKDGVNLDALNDAVGELKEKLNKPNYKVNVIMPYYDVHTLMTEFGEVDGVNLNMENEEDRKAYMRYQMDEHIRRFEEGGYEHVQLMGFYHVVESVSNDYDTAEIIIPMIQYANQYAADKGYITLWNPYNALGTNYTRWKDFGFTRCVQQINYFPDNAYTGGHQSNDQPKSAIERTAADTGDRDMGITLEWSYLNQASTHPDTEYDGVKHFKEYMEGGVKYGYMNRAYNNFQLDGGANSIYNDCVTSDNDYVRSAYDELYKFIKCTLTEEDIKWYSDFGQ